MKSIIISAAFLLGAGAAWAADISYVGFEQNVEEHANTPTTGWRNTTPAKPLDIDGDNILGTDGYSLPKSGLQLLPSYIGSVTKLAASENGGTSWGYMDNPSDPSGSDTVGWAMWFNSADLVQFTINGTDLNGKTLRLGVLTSGYIGTGETLHLTQTVGGSVTVSSGALTAAHDDGLDVAFFDLGNVADGDTFKVSATGLTLGYLHASGLTFDSRPNAGTVFFFE